MTSPNRLRHQIDYVIVKPLFILGALWKYGVAEKAEVCNQEKNIRHSLPQAQPAFRRIVFRRIFSEGIVSALLYTKAAWAPPCVALLAVLLNQLAVSLNALAVSLNANRQDKNNEIYQLHTANCTSPM